MHRKRNVRARQPTPRRSDEHPTSVMEGTKAPGFIFHPSPPPRINPSPMAKTVGHPTRRKASGIPDRAVLCDLFPTTVIIEVIVASDAATYVFAGGRGRQSRVTLLTPAIEAVERGHRRGGCQVRGSIRRREVCRPPQRCRKRVRRR